MSGQVPVLSLVGDRRRNHRGTVPVPDIVLDDQYGPNAPLLRAGVFSQAGVIDIPAPEGEVT